MLEAQPSILQLAMNHALFAVVMIACLLPTFLSRYAIYGNPFESGYVSLKDWAWSSPNFLAVLFSSEHGLLVWTPVLALACIGVVIFALREPRVGGAILAAMLAFYFFIACYPIGPNLVVRQSILRFADSDLHRWFSCLLCSHRAILRVTTSGDCLSPALRLRFSSSGTWRSSLSGERILFRRAGRSCGA